MCPFCVCSLHFVLPLFVCLFCIFVVILYLAFASLSVCFTDFPKININSYFKQRFCPSVPFGNRSVTLAKYYTVLHYFCKLLYFNKYDMCFLNSKLFISSWASLITTCWPPLTLNGLPTRHFLQYFECLCKNPVSDHIHSVSRPDVASSQMTGSVL